MQNKRSKRSKMRAAKHTAGYGAKKKHRGSGHRGGVGKSAGGKRSSAKLMKVLKAKKGKLLGRYGFRSLNKKLDVINLQDIQERLASLVEEGKASKSQDTYSLDLGTLGYSKLLSKGSVKVKLNLKIDAATQNAIEKVEKAGGKVILPENNKD